VLEETEKEGMALEACFKGQNFLFQAQRTQSLLALEVLAIQTEQTQLR
jgi:hypothetical protein